MINTSAMKLVCTLAVAWMLPRTLGTPDCDEALQSCNTVEAAAAQALLQTDKASLVTEQLAEDPGHAGHDCYSKYDGQRLLRLTLCTQDAIDRFLDADCTNFNDEIGFVLPKEGQCIEEDATCSEAATRHLLTAFPGHVKLVSSDAGAYFRDKLKRGASHAHRQNDGRHRPSTDDSFYRRWPSMKERLERVEQVVKDSNGVAVIEEIGKSVENRPIIAVRLTGRNFKQGLAPGRVLFTFNLHAREWLSGMAGVYAVEKMVAKAKHDGSWLAGMEAVFVPISNPDGVLWSETEDRYWRKNRAKNSGSHCPGVDLNRNFDKAYGMFKTASTDPCDDTYRGSHARSEPESQALGRIIDSGVTVHIDVHAYGEMILSSWGWTTEPHPRYKEIVDLQEKMKDAIKSKHGSTWQASDNIWKRAAGIFSDYSTSTGALGFTYEVRPSKCKNSDNKPGCVTSSWDGFAPPEDNIVPAVEEVLEGLYAAVAWAQAKAAAAQNPADCSFELNFCNWSEAKDDDFNWRRLSGPTKSRDTGPDSAADGNTYAYIETSGQNRRTGQTAILTSPPLILSEATKLTFKYHMYGKSMGSLTVTVDGKDVWRESGDQGNAWNDAVVDLSHYTGKTPTVAFVGRRGSSWTGDAAIDAVKFVPSTPTTAETTTTTTTTTTKTEQQTSATSLECSFESNFCDWSNSKTDNFDWTRSSGPTKSRDTGPDGAADGNMYAYIETSGKLNKNARAILSSPPLFLSHPKQLSFKYHMYGQGMGHLGVAVKGNRKWEWLKSGDQGNGWKDAVVDLSKYTGKTVTVLFVGIRGSDWTGDAAIDAVRLD